MFGPCFISWLVLLLESAMTSLPTKMASFLKWDVCLHGDMCARGKLNNSADAARFNFIEGLGY